MIVENHYLLATGELPSVSYVLVALPARPYLSLRLEPPPARVGAVMVESGHVAAAGHVDECTAETGQTFLPEVLAGIIGETQGQPFLVNRLGQMLTQDLVRDVTIPINYLHLEHVLARLGYENNSHFYSIVSKATPHRELLLPMLFYNEVRTNLRETATMELVMYGVLRVVEAEGGQQVARIANPIYQKVLLLTFAPALEQPLNGLIRHRYLIGDTLDFEGVLASFTASMEEHGVRLLRNAQTGRPSG